MLSENPTENDGKKSILKKSDGKPIKKIVSICINDVSIIDNTISDDNEFEYNEKDPLMFVSEAIFPFTNELVPITHCDRCTSPDQKFSMEEFLINVENKLDIARVNETEIVEEITNSGKTRNVNCNTLYTTDVAFLHNTIVNQDKKKTKEERKKEREKKKEEEMMKKYQIEQEAKHRAIAKSKCGRWVKFNIKIGEGGYKFVYRGYDVEEAKNVAWCEFKREHVDTKEKRQSMFRETEIMLKMNHSHIVRCFDVLREWHVYEDPQTIIDEKGIVIIQELMGEGTLKNIIKKNFLEGHCILKFPLITRWWHQILDALRYMHLKCDPPIIHRDLKADNCFLYGQTDDEYLNVKVGDFGLATHVHTSGRKTMLGTLGFMAPEIFDEKYDESVDIYAFGMLMLEVMTNRTPFDECDTIVQVAAKTLSGKGPKVIEMVGDKWLREIINSCIHPLSCFRPTAEELFFHPIFQPKGLPVEVELNYDNISDRTEVIDRFIANIPSCTKINLRLRFRDKRMLQELGLDDGESLEFDLDIYKAEDQDIPDLIQNLRLEYEDKLSRVYDNPKILDKSTISAHLDKLFLSIKLQMQCLVKHLLGRRWRDILDSLVANKTAKLSEGEMESGDDQDEGMNSFTIISQYKGMWTKAKRALDKEMVAYRDNSLKDTNVSHVEHNFHIDGKPITTNESIPTEAESLENVVLEKPLIENPIFVKTVSQSPVEGSISYLNSFTDSEQMDNPNLIQASVFNQDTVQITSVQGPSLAATTGSNTITMFDSRDLYKETTPLDIITMHKDSQCETDSQKDILNGSYNVKVQNIEFNAHTNLICVTFNVEIPDFSKSESGKWVLCYKCVINENTSIIDNLELNTSDDLAGKIDNDIQLALRETLLCILKLIQNDRKSVMINQNFIFYPRKENMFLEPLTETNISKVNIRSNVAAHEIIVPEDPCIEINNIKPNEHRTISVDHSTINSSFNLDSLFDQENTIILTKRFEDEKYIVKAFSISCGSAVVINNNGTIQNIKKTTIISPKLDSDENIFVRELDKTDLSMDKAIHILTLLQEKIEELSIKNHNLTDLTSKIIYEYKPNVEINKKPQAVDPIDKQKIIEQVLIQKTEIEKLQKQQIELISLLSNQQIIVPPDIDQSVVSNNPNKLISNSEQDILNTQKINNKMCSHFSGQQFINVNPMPMNNDGRLFMQNNVYVTPEDLEYQNSNNFLLDNAIRNQMVHMKTPVNENILYNSSSNVNKDFVSIDNSMRFKSKKEVPNIGDVTRAYNDISNPYANDRLEYFDRNMYHQLRFLNNDQIPENDLHCKINPVSSVPNIQERISDFKTPETNLTQQMYPQKYPYFYQIPYQNMRGEQLINFRCPPQSMQNFYDPAMFLINSQYSNPEELNNLRKEQVLYDHSTVDDIKLTEINYKEKQLQPDPNLFSVNTNFAASENPNINYHDNNCSINQKSLEKASEACINIQMNPLEEKIKDVFNNR